MYEQVKKTTEKKSQMAANGVSKKKNNNAPTSRFVDNRPEAIQMRRLRELAENNHQNEKLRQLHHLVAAHSRVIQREEKTVGGVEVDVGHGYTSWEGWHINWTLGGQDKRGNEQYHLTSEDRSQHYFFIIDGDDLEDTKPKADFVPKRGKHGGISSAPSDVQAFVRNNIRDLMG